MHIRMGMDAATTIQNVADCVCEIPSCPPPHSSDCFSKEKFYLHLLKSH